MRWLLLLLVLLATTPSIQAATYCVDFVGGNDANTGIPATNCHSASNNAWKRAPGMIGFAGTYTHANGDQIIFKGGVTWGVANFNMVIPNGGASGNRDYWGVDLLWFSGGSFARPIFDMGGARPTNDIVISVQNFSNLNIDNIEIKNQLLPTIVSPFCLAAIQINGTNSNITISNMNIHDWSMTSPGANNDAGSIGGICVNTSGSNTNIIIDHFTCNGNAGVGGCVNGADEIRFSDMCCAPNILLGPGSSIHDNKIHDLRNCLDPNQHGNAIEPFNTTNIYNNLIFNTSTNCNTDAIFAMGTPCNPGVNGVTNIYNNVIYGGGEIDWDCDSSNDSSATLNLYNNTVEDGAGEFLHLTVRGFTLGTLNIKNNHYITTMAGNPACYNVSGCGSVTTVSDDFPTHSIKMSQTTATSQGYTTGNNYAPTLGTNSTVGAGTNLTSSCGGGFVSLCSDTTDGNTRTAVARPAPAALWDAGAYFFQSSGPAVNLNPGNLSFGNQTVNTTSAFQETTLTNSGTTALTITSISLSGTNPNDFALPTSSSPCPISPSTLAASATCTIRVTFTPLTTGARSASVSVADNATGSPHTVPLTGTGTGAGGGNKGCAVVGSAILVKGTCQ